MEKVISQLSFEQVDCVLLDTFDTTERSQRAHRANRGMQNEPHVDAQRIATHEQISLWDKEGRGAGRETKPDKGAESNGLTQGVRSLPATRI